MNSVPHGRGTPHARPPWHRLPTIPEPSATHGDRQAGAGRGSERPRRAKAWWRMTPRDYTALQALRERVASDIARALRCNRARLPALYAEARRLAMVSLVVEAAE